MFPCISEMDQGPNIGVGGLAGIWSTGHYLIISSLYHFCNPCFPRTVWPLGGMPTQHREKTLEAQKSFKDPNNIHFLSTPLTMLTLWFDHANPVSSLQCQLHVFYYHILKYLNANIYIIILWHSCHLSISIMSYITWVNCYIPLVGLDIDGLFETHFRILYLYHLHKEVLKCYIL